MSTSHRKLTPLIQEHIEFCIKKLNSVDPIVLESGSGKEERSKIREQLRKIAKKYDKLYLEIHRTQLCSLLEKNDKIIYERGNMSDRLISRWE